MRYSSDWRIRHNDRISDHFFPDYQYSQFNYPHIVPYCAIPNYWSLMEYELEDLIDKKYKYELYKLLLKRDGYYTEIKQTNPTIVSKDKSFKKVEFASNIVNEKIKTENDNSEFLKKLHNNPNKYDFEKFSYHNSIKSSSRVILPSISSNKTNSKDNKNNNITITNNNNSVNINTSKSNNQ